MRTYLKGRELKLRLQLTGIPASLNQLPKESYFQGPHIDAKRAGVHRDQVIA